MKTKLFETYEIQYFELGIASFNLHVYCLTRDFIVSTLAFNLLTRAFNLATRTFSLATRAFNLATRAFSVVTRRVELLTRGLELLTRRSEFATHGFKLDAGRFEPITRNSCFTFPEDKVVYIFSFSEFC